MPDETYKQNAWEFLNLATRALLNPNCLEASHPLVSEGKNKIIVKLSKRKDIDLILRANAATINFCGGNIKNCWEMNELKF